MPAYQGPVTPPPAPVYQGPPTPPPYHGPATPPPYQGPSTPPPMHMRQGPIHVGPPGPPGPPAFGAPAPARGGSKGPIIAAVGCGTLALLAVVLLLVLAAIGSQVDNPTTTPSYPPPSIDYTPPTFSTPFGRYGAHPDFAGTWTGKGFQTEPKPSTWNIKITLSANRALGNVEYGDGACTGFLTVRSSDSTTTEASELVSGNDCEVTGYLTLKLIGTDTMRYEWKKYSSDTRPAATGTLTRD